MKTGCIIQARTTSSRLPGKVLKVINFLENTTVLEEVIDRVGQCKGLDQIIIATTVNEDDDAIASLAEKKGVSCYRGSEYDVLERYYLAALENGLDRVLRITSDCPFTDPLILQGIIDLFDSGSYDYVSNAIQRTFPHGLDCEMFTFDSLETAYNSTEFVERDMFYREHVTTYIYGSPDVFRLGNYSMPNGLDCHDIRITIDTEEDYLLACVLRSYLQDGYTYEDIISVFNEKPFIAGINAGSMQKKQYSSANDEIDAAIRLLRLQEMNKAADILDQYRHGSLEI